MNITLHIETVIEPIPSLKSVKVPPTKKGSNQLNFNKILIPTFQLRTIHSAEPEVGMDTVSETRAS